MLGWVCFGYYIFIYLIGLFKATDSSLPKDSSLEELPLLSLIVPCYNEETLIAAKLDNLLALDYPQDKLEILFVDGSSSDNTTGVIASYLHHAHLKLIKTDKRGKIVQVNRALREARGEFIINTDVDGTMRPDCLRKIVQEFSKSENVAVVGIYSYPHESHIADRYHWFTQNKGRILESRALTSSIIVAVCYAFRRDLLERFPKDVVADDVYISYLANSQGRKTSYIATTYVKEARGPQTLEGFLQHKFRKSNAFLKETLRFLYKIQESDSIWKTMFITKLMQLTILPWLFSFWFITTASLLSLKRLDVVFWGVVFLWLLLFATHIIFKTIRNLPDASKSFNLPLAIVVFLISNFILLVNGFCFLFYRQTSSYRKLNT